MLTGLRVSPLVYKRVFCRLEQTVFCRLDYSMGSHKCEPIEQNFEGLQMKK